MAAAAGRSQHFGSACGLTLKSSDAMDLPEARLAVAGSFSASVLLPALSFNGHNPESRLVDVGGQGLSWEGTPAGLVLDAGLVNEVRGR
jgi:hypothetical protein